MIRPIAISLSPNTEADDVLLSAKTLINPLNFTGQKNILQLEKDFESIFSPGFMALSLDSGRGALFLILKALGIKKDDSVCLQAFTCVAVPNSVTWTGATPIYIDIDRTYNIDPRDLERKLDKKTKAVIIQHTFGIPANVGEIKNVIKKAERKYGTKIFMIEDCAHALGMRIGNNNAGEFGDASFFSFGRDKVISSVFGGMVLTKDEILFGKFQKIRESLNTPSYFWQVGQLLHPILFNTLILPLYYFGFGKFGLGKILLYILQKLHVLSVPVTSEEKRGIRPWGAPHKMSNALSVLAIHQLKKLRIFNLHRRRLARLYFDNLKGKGFGLATLASEKSIWLRYPIYTKNAKSILQSIKDNKVLLGSWYKGVIEPATDLVGVGYKKGSCPLAEDYSENCINLPTYPALDEDGAKKVIDLLIK